VTLARKTNSGEGTRAVETVSRHTGCHPLRQRRAVGLSAGL